MLLRIVCAEWTPIASNVVASATQLCKSREGSRRFGVHRVHLKSCLALVEAPRSDRDLADREEKDTIPAE